MASGPVPGTAIDSVTVLASGASVTFKTSLIKGELYLLKATGSVDVGTDKVDAEFGGFGSGAIGKDTVGGVDVGIDIGTQVLRLKMTGRQKWAGPYNPNHVYYTVVTGTGIPLTCKLTKSGTAAATGSIIVALVRLSPFPPQITTQPIDSVQIPVTQTIVHTKVNLTKSAVYLLQCSGEATVGGAGGLGDADYMDYGTDANPNPAGALDVGDNNTDYGVGVDDTIITHTTPATPHKYWWGPLRLDHLYYCLYAGTGNPITLLFFDVGYSDNSTTVKLKLKVYSVP